MSRPDFLREPFELVAELIQAAFDPNATPEARANACERIRDLSSHFLSKLALDDDWRHLLETLGRDTDHGEVAGDGPWSPACAFESVPDACSPAPIDTIRPLFCLYVQDLRRLLSDDFRDAPAVPLKPLDPMLDPAERVLTSSGAVSTPRAPTEDYARRLPWTLLNHGTGLLAIADRWPSATEPVAAFWSEVIHNRPHLGVPQRLAEILGRFLAGGRGRGELFNEIALWIDQYVEREIFDFFSIDDLAERHFDLRIAVVGWIRRAEITDPKATAAIEIYSTCRFLRHAAAADLLRCWREGRNDPQKATTAYRRFNHQGDTMFERALRAVLRQPTDAMAERISARDRQALTLVKHLRDLIPNIHEYGALSHEGES